MAFFEFKKWFFDVSGGRNEYLILFVSLIKLGNRYYTSLQIHGTKRDSETRFQASFSCLKTAHQKGIEPHCMLFNEGEIRFGDGTSQIHLDFDDCLIHLDYTGNMTGSSGPALFSLRGRSLDWIPLILHGSVSGSILVKGVPVTFNDAPGYCDEVRSTFMPWKVPLTRLYWGRLHHESLSLSYSVLLNPMTGLPVSRLFLEVDGHHFVINGLRLEILHHKIGSGMNFNYPDHYKLHGHSEGISISIEVSNHQEMILNDFMDYRKEYGALATRLLRWISRDPKGIKFYATASTDMRLNGKEYRIENAGLVDEYVEFN